MPDTEITNVINPMILITMTVLSRNNNKYIFSFSLILWQDCSVLKSTDINTITKRSCDDVCPYQLFKVCVCVCVCVCHFVGVCVCVCLCTCKGMRACACTLSSLKLHTLTMHVFKFKTILDNIMDMILPLWLKMQACAASHWLLSFEWEQ